MLHTIKLCHVLLAQTCKNSPSFKSIGQLAGHIDDKLKSKFADKVKALNPQPKHPFNPRSFRSYISRLTEDINNCKIFSSQTGNYGDFLAIFCGKDNLNDFKDHPPLLEPSEIRSWLDKLIDAESYDSVDAKIVEPESRSSSAEQTNWPPSFVKFQEYFEELEFGSRRIRVNCISQSLFWAGTFIERKAQKIAQSQNEYRYLLTEREGNRNKEKLEKLVLADIGLAGKVFIRTLYNCHLPNPLESNEIPFPLYNDIVIYEEWDDESGRFHFLEAIIGITPGQSKKIKNFSIEIAFERGDALFRWFEDTWNKITDQSKPA